MEPVSIEIEEYIEKQTRYQLVDVRTAAEYMEGSAHNSINVPMFDEEERARIGNIYKRSPRAARFAALDLLGPKLPRFIRRIHRHCWGKTPLIVCWRGGMRSRFTVELLLLAGVNARQLAGGYKAYRRFIRQKLSDFPLKNPLVILKGKTGTGKTMLLKALADKGLRILDLEGLAGHRGSAFGGFLDQPAVSQKNFDARLYFKLLELNSSQWLVVEGESKRIGNVYLPDFLYNRMRRAPVIETDAPRELRIRRIVEEYAPADQAAKDKIRLALQRLKGKLAPTVTKQLAECLEREDYHSFADILLRRHYDNIYDFQLPGKEVLLKVDTTDMEKAANDIAAVLTASGSAGKT